MPLEHVSMWHETLGWQRISINEADSLFSETVSADSHLLICDLCHKHVIFVKGIKPKSYFKHNNGDPDKECDDRTQALSRSGQEILRSTITNPMRLIVTHNLFYLEVGFLPMPNDILEQAEKMKLQACVLAKEKVLLTKNIDRSNFSSEMTVFHPIKNCFSEKYQIKIVPDNNIGTNLPLFNREFQGLNTNGTLFDYQSGKKIPLDGDVEVNKKFYLLTSNLYIGVPLDIEIYKVLPQGIYCLYTVVAHKVTKSTSEFFLRYRARLTNVPTKIVPVWPVLHEGDHYIETDRHKLLFFLKGDSSVKIEPPISARNIDVYRPCETDSVQLICINNASRIRMVWAARLSVLKYLSVRYNPDEVVYSDITLEQVSACTEDQTTLNNGIHYSLPKRKRLYVTVKYDGQVVRKRNNEVIYSKKVKANETVLLERISYGEDIFVYHGMDESLSVSFRRGDRTGSQNDSAVLAALNACTGVYVKFPHRIGWIVSKLAGMPNTKAFVLATMQEGRIRKDAIKLIGKIIKEGDFNGNRD